MFEWVQHLIAQGVELILQPRLLVTRNKFHRLGEISNLSLISLFVVIEELCELLVVSELGLLHWHNLLNMLLEVLQVVH